MLTIMSLRISDASPSAVRCGPPSVDPGCGGRLGPGDLVPVREGPGDHAVDAGRQALVERDVLRRLDRLGQDQQHAVVAGEVVAARPVHLERPPGALDAAEEDLGEPQGVEPGELLERRSPAGSRAGGGARSPVGGSPRPKLGRQLDARAGSSRNSTDLGKKVSQQLIGIADPVLDVPELGDLGEPARQLVRRSARRARPPPPRACVTTTSRKCCCRSPGGCRCRP